MKTKTKTTPLAFATKYNRLLHDEREIYLSYTYDGKETELDVMTFHAIGNELFVIVITKDGLANITVRPREIVFHFPPCIVHVSDYKFTLSYFDDNSRLRVTEIVIPEF